MAWASNYFNLQTMRALSRSYGDISIVTRSPTVSRTQRLRILPEMVASTRCLLSSSTEHGPRQNGLDDTFEFDGHFFHKAIG